MSRLTHLKHLIVTALGVGAVVVACRAAQPEAPPLAPRPGLVGRSAEPAPKEDPAPSAPNQSFPISTPGDGGAPNKANPDMPATPIPNPMPKNNGPVTTTSVPTPVFGADQYQMVDAGLRDAPKSQDALPPLADANLPQDGARGDALLPPPSKDAGR
ncbi:MAG TPA: hypothetical protein VGM39_18570 [Kofleriaceae bacterium]|jgi:hypothetical protein